MGIFGKAVTARAASVLALSTTLGATTGAASAQGITAENAPNQFVTSGETRFAYRSFGKGSPVVFLNRFRATMDHWDPAFVNPVATRHRVILFDNAGVSLSTGETPSTFAGMADDVARFVRALDIEKADFVGWSIGGAVAQALLVQHPQIVRRAVLIATFPPGGTAEKFPPVSEEVRRATSNPTPVAEDFLFLFYAPSQTSRNAGLASLKRTAARVPPSPPVSREASVKARAALEHWYRGGDGILVSIKTIDKPVLVANGYYDAMFPAHQSFVLGREIPTARLALYPDSGHAFMFQYPEQFARLMIDFLEDPQNKP